MAIKRKSRITSDDCIGVSSVKDFWALRLLWTDLPIHLPSTNPVSVRLAIFALSNPFSRPLRSISNQDYMLCAYRFQTADQYKNASSLTYVPASSSNVLEMNLPWVSDRNKADLILNSDYKKMGDFATRITDVDIWSATIISPHFEQSGPSENQSWTFAFLVWVFFFL